MNFPPQLKDLALHWVLTGPLTISCGGRGEGGRGGEGGVARVLREEQVGSWPETEDPLWWVL